MGNKDVPEVLRAAGHRVWTDKDCGIADRAADTDWIREGTKRRLALLTKDLGGKDMEALMEAVRVYGGRCFMVVRGEMSGQRLGEVIVAAAGSIRSFLEHHDPPFIARIQQDCRVVLWRNWPGA